MPFFILTIAMFLTMLGGCSYQNKSILLKTPHKIKTYGAPIIRYNAPQEESVESYAHRIEPDNRIRIIQLNPDLIEASSALNNESGFLVDINGNVRLPIVGEVFLQGLTRQEAAKLLEKVYSGYYKSPMFQVEIINMFVMILGESGSNTGGYFMPLEKERTHLLEVLGKAGGIPSFAKIKFVRILRGNFQDPQIIIVDMSQLAVIKEEDLIMRNGDFVYLEPKGIRLLSDAIAPYFVVFSVLNFFGTILLISNSIGFRQNN